MEEPKLLLVSIPESLPPVVSPYESELEQHPQTLLLTEESEAAIQNACSSISNSVHDQNVEEPSIASKHIFDLIDVGHSTELVRGVDIDVAGMWKIVANFQDSGLEGFIDFDWFNQVCLSRTPVSCTCFRHVAKRTALARARCTRTGSYKPSPGRDLDHP